MPQYHYEATMGPIRRMDRSPIDLAVYYVRIIAPDCGKVELHPKMGSGIIRTEKPISQDTLELMIEDFKDLGVKFYQLK